MTDDFASQSQLLCQACLEELGADGCTLYLHGMVKDLLKQAWESGELVQSSGGGRWIAAMPVWHGHTGGGALIVAWDRTTEPELAERELLRAAANVASLMAPRFVREGALSRAHEEIQALKGEVAQESHLAGVGRLAAGVAHELSQPLTAVLTMVGSLSRAVQDPVSVRRLHIIQDAVQKCKGIIEKLLVYSRTSMEKENEITFSRFVRASTDINQVVANSVELLRDELAEAKISAQVKYSDLPQVRANSTQWTQALTNILSFLRDCHKVGKTAGPVIKISTSYDKKEIGLSFDTNCTLLSKEEMAKIMRLYGAYGDGTGGISCKCDHSVVDQLPEHFLSDEDLPVWSRVLSDLRIKREGSSYPELRKEPENVFSYLNIFRVFPFDLLFSSFFLHCTSEHYLIDLYSPYASTLPFRRRSPALIISVLDAR